MINWFSKNFIEKPVSGPVGAKIMMVFMRWYVTLMATPCLMDFFERLADFYCIAEKPSWQRYQVYLLLRKVIDTLLARNATGELRCLLGSDKRPVKLCAAKSLRNAGKEWKEEAENALKMIRDSGVKDFCTTLANIKH